MRIRWLGKTGLQVSEICLGTGCFGGLGSFEHTGTLNQADADRVVSIALNAGINYAARNLMKGLAISEKNGWEKFVTLEAIRLMRLS